MIVVPIGSYFLTVGTVFKGALSDDLLQAPSLNADPSQAIRRTPEHWLRFWPMWC